LIIYGAYQLSFIFGGYLIRAETHFARKARIMGWIDIAKQQGYLAGLLLSWGFYEALEYYGILTALSQVTLLHFAILPLQIIIIMVLLGAFRVK
jgi:hypothetical protein